MLSALLMIYGLFLTPVGIVWFMWDDRSTGPGWAMGSAILALLIGSGLNQLGF